MTFRLDFSESPETSLRRCATDRIEHAIAQLDTARSQDPRGAVHETRKDVKKTRALLRLYRSDLAPATYRRENRALRGAGRELSGMRDADVLLATTGGLAERFAGQVPEGAFDALLEGRLEDGPPAPSQEEAVESARELLAGVLGRVDDWSLREADPRLLRNELRRTYARGRRAFLQAEQEPSDERLHDWRKRVKDLRYQQQLLRAAWPQVLGAHAKAAKTLGELLGDDHDLAVLQERTGSSGESDEVHALIARRRLELQQEAFRLGARVYAESPKRFAARVGRYLRAAVHDGRAELVG